MPLAWIVPSALWLVLHFPAEACKKGTVASSKAARGSAEICSKGNMTANTARAIQRGTNVTLSCHLAELHLPEWCRVGIFLNNSERARSRGRSVSQTFRVNAYGKHTFTCKTMCGERKRLVCGIDIKCGNPPDEPRNVSCIQTGMDGHPLCTWDKGRLTYLDTTYVIQLSNGTQGWCFSEERLNETFGSLALSKLSFHSNYTIMVSASNRLGNASSQPLTFMLIDIVKPHPPDFFVEFDNSSATNCTLFLHSEAQAQHYRLRYRPLTRHSWSTVEGFSSEQYHLQGLQPDTAYEFQVSCKIHPERGLWSDWSTEQTRTPEAEPTGILDVWYQQQDVGSQQQNISLFWKALSKSEAGGRILGYTVTFEALDQQNPPRESHHTTQTSFSRLTPRVGYRIRVTAWNSRGRSPPASILTDLGTQDLPPPQQVSAVAMGNSSILVSWKPPLGSAVPLSGYVVEWAETRRKPHLEPQHSWAKLPRTTLSAVIAEHIKDNMCYQIHVFALYQDRAGQAASVRGCSTAQAFPGGTLHIPELQPGELSGAGPRGSSDRLRLQTAGGWVTLVLTCSFFIFSACVCSLPPARKVFHSLLSSLLPQWQSKAIPDPANATWAKTFLATKAELSSPSLPFLPGSAAFEEPELTALEEQRDPSKLPVGPAGHGQRARLGSGDEQQPSGLYQRLVAEGMEPPQPEYITSPGPVEPPASPDSEPEGHPLSLFPAALLPPALCGEGTLTLDRVTLSCSSLAPWGRDGPDSPVLRR